MKVETQLLGKVNFTCCAGVWQQRISINLRVCIFIFQKCRVKIQTYAQKQLSSWWSFVWQLKRKILTGKIFFQILYAFIRYISSKWVLSQKSVVTHYWGKFLQLIVFRRQIIAPTKHSFSISLIFRMQACLYKRYNSDLIELLLLFVAGITEEKIYWCIVIWTIIWKPNICLYGVLTWLVFSEVLFKISGFLIYTHNFYRFRRNQSQQFNRQNWFCLVTNQLLTLQHFAFISGFPVSVSCFIGLSSIARKKLLGKIVEHNLEDAISDVIKQVIHLNTSLYFLSQSLSNF